MSKRSRTSRGALTGTQKATVKSMIRGYVDSRSERKVFVSNIAPTASLTTGNVVTVTQGLVQGDNLDNRSGDKIFLEKIYLRMQLALPIAATNASLRFIVFLDTMANGSVPVTADVIQSSVIYGAYQQINLLKNRFHILLDHTQAMVVGASNQTWHKDYVLPVNKAITFQDGTNIPGANGKNALFVLLLTDAAVNTPSYSFSTELLYRDM